MYNVYNTKTIEQKARVLRNRGLQENTDFRIIYFNNEAEIKMIETEKTLNIFKETFKSI